MASLAASMHEAQDLETRNQDKPALTPPTSEDWSKNDGSDLSDLEQDNDDGEIEPDHYWDGGEIPVFKPTMAQFRSFKDFVAKIDKYGMKSGIVKVIPPKEWIDSLPALDQSVKGIKVKNPITQEFAGTHGTYTQANIEKQRSYNLPQWKALTEESQHQPPARRGERRKNTDKPMRVPSKPRTASIALTDGDGSAKRKPGRPRKTPLPPIKTAIKEEQDSNDACVQGPPTPTSPENMSKEIDVEQKPDIMGKLAQARQVKSARGKPKNGQQKAKGSQPKSVSERRKYNRREVADQIDETAFENFDYRMLNKDEFTPERCAELETLYWKSLTFAPPMYGADMPGSLFDDTTTSWNVAKLENILDVLGQNVPGVNTAYLYLGMWKATYAWHLEDVDLYSINYIHFGAPKQWYSISQEDARRFENAMKSIWPQDAKNCSQFLRHKTYLISPAVLQSQFNIRVNKLVHYEGEFVITFPYGYHSGYNLGYNCAESVNFATEAWLNYGKIAKKCDCEADSVWIDVEDIERKLRGEPTPEFYDETDDDDLGVNDTHFADLPSPPASVVGKAKAVSRKRKREQSTAVAPKIVKKIRIRLKSSYVEPCVLCPNDMPFESLLQTDTGRYAHRVCALYTPETYMEEDDGAETICGIANIDKARLDLKCSFCRSKKGACFQCSSKKCTRAFHATCAAAAGVQVDFGPVPVYGEDGTEYASEAYDFRCRFHRAKRPKNATGDSLENSDLIQDFARTLEQHHVVQIQYAQGDVFAGVVIENRPSEHSVVVTVLPEGDRIEVEWKYILALDPADSQLPKVSASAKPLPSHMDRSAVQSRNLEFGPPQADDVFGDAQYPYKWAEFHTAPQPRNPAQAKVDFQEVNRIWYYLGMTSTEAKAQFTENAAIRRHNVAGNFLESVKPVVAAVKRQPIGPNYPSGVNYHALNGAMAAARGQSQAFPRQQNTGYDSQPRARQDLAITQSYYDPRRQSGQSERLNGTQQTYQVQPAPMYLNKPQSSTVWSPMRSAGPYVMPVPASLVRKPSLTDFIRSPNPVKMEKDQSRSEKLSAKPRHTGMMPLADLLAKPHDSPTVGGTTVLQSTAEQNCPSHLAEYPYLKNSYLRRPKTYQSPYRSGGGYSGLATNTQTEGPTEQFSKPSQPPPTMERAAYTSVASRYSHNSSSHPAPVERRLPSQYLHQSPQAFQQHVRREAANEDKDVYNKMFSQFRHATSRVIAPQQQLQSEIGGRPSTLHVRDLCVDQNIEVVPLGAYGTREQNYAVTPAVPCAKPASYGTLQMQTAAPLPPAM